MPGQPTRLQASEQHRKKTDDRADSETATHKRGATIDNSYITHSLFSQAYPLTVAMSNPMDPSCSRRCSSFAPGGEITARKRTPVVQMVGNGMSVPTCGAMWTYVDGFVYRNPNNEAHEVRVLASTLEHA